ncbi:protein spaetzle 4 isoform X4 [Leguminivora glycinivorella]|uniref:protein spaetzle 4 isoform X4 n=1 Tax=Leguminivora glycinivorella TaxID=1035111 RepID=UPI0020109BDD|nr:protein spaetzle 4 isoform X4 [Leguminivora glycinivorella]
MRVAIAFIFVVPHVLGYDYASACARPQRAGRARASAPCDLSKQSYCTSPGEGYPWHAIRRFVKENQGLMRRMYGEERHIAVLKAELENFIEDDEDENVKKTADFAEDIIKTKMMYTKKSHGRAMKVKPHFRPIQSNSNRKSDNDTLRVKPLDFDEHEKVKTDRIDTNVNTVNKKKEEFHPKPTQPEAMRPAVIKLRGANACESKEEMAAPFWANSTRGEVLALLNMYPFEQYIHLETCVNEKKQMYCREGCRCEQQYRLHRLLAYDPRNECRGIFADWFKFPACCVCKCYDVPLEFRARSPRILHPQYGEEVKRVIYEDVARDWYMSAFDDEEDLF